MKRNCYSPELKVEVDLQKEIDKLNDKIGQITVENDFVKKVSGK